MASLQRATTLWVSAASQNSPEIHLSFHPEELLHHLVRLLFRPALEYFLLCEEPALEVPVMKQDRIKYRRGSYEVNTKKKITETNSQSYLVFRTQASAFCITMETLMMDSNLIP